MELCHTVNPENLSTDISESSNESVLPSNAKYLFFPNLIQNHHPGNLPSPKFGWCLGCSNSHKFFSNYFLHVLLLRLAFKFPLASKHLSPYSSLYGYERQCKVWQNGISWKNVSGFSTIEKRIWNRLASSTFFIKLEHRGGLQAVVRLI